MCGGGVLSYLVLIPMIKFFGASIPGVVAPGKMAIADMQPDDVRGAYILYIGSGAVAAGGILSLLRSMPTIWHGLREGLRDVGFLNKGAVAPAGPVPRTERDLSMKFVGIGIIVLMAAIVAAPMLLDAGIGAKVLGALLIVVFGFLFVTVSSRLTGEIGSSSNPISGMTIATLLLTCLIFLVVGWTGSAYYVTALSVGAIVCIAAPWKVRVFPCHPKVETVVQEKIGKNWANHTTLRGAASSFNQYSVPFHGRCQPSFDVD